MFIMFKKIILFIISILCFFGFAFVSNTAYANNNDNLLDEVLWDDEQQIINKNNIQSVDKSIIMKIVEFMLKISVLVWVMVFIYGWIRFMLSLWDDWKAKKIRNTLAVSLLWLIISFWAYIILQIIISTWFTLKWF